MIDPNILLNRLKTVLNKVMAVLIKTDRGGSFVGLEDGRTDGVRDGDKLKKDVGLSEELTLGAIEGIIDFVGSKDGEADGIVDGFKEVLGSKEGFALGINDGNKEGITLGSAVG